MRHRHQGPPDRACAGCIDEANEIADEKARRSWRWILIVYFIGLIILVLVIVSRLNRLEGL